jgi:hypothetical protein
LEHKALHTSESDGDLPLIDLDLAGGPELAPAATPPVHFQSVRDQLESVGQERVTADPERDQLLQECRERFDAQLAHDLDYTVQRLWRWAAHIPASLEPLTRELFSRLEKGRVLLQTLSGWSSARAEVRCWQATQQFHCDALALADRLLRREQGQRLRVRSPRVLRRYQVSEAASASSPLQAVGNGLDQALPGILAHRYGLSPLAAAAYGLRCTLLPRPAFCWPLFLKKAARFAADGGLDALTSASGVRLEIRGRESFLSNRDLFSEPGTRTRSNVILAFSHRHSTLDFVLLGHALNGLEHAVWGNDLYLPASAKRDPHSVLVRSGSKRDLEPVFAASTEILADRGWCLLIAVDGSAPYLCYGQHMRAKRGIRLLIDYLNSKTAGRRRRTFIVPLTLDDTAFLVKGRDSSACITFHTPICTENIEAPASDGADAINQSDPLLNYLESVFIANSGLVRHGWLTPRVVETTRRVSAELTQRRDWRTVLRRRLHASLTDLAHDWADPNEDLHGHRSPIAGQTAARRRAASVPPPASAALDLDLRPAVFPAEAFAPIVGRLAELGSDRVVSDDVRDSWLADYRSRFNRQVTNDLRYNLQALQSWSDLLKRHGDPWITDGLRRMHELATLLAHSDPWTTSRLELDSWNSFHQFYCDALQLADRLLALEQGRHVVRQEPPTLKRTEFPGASSYRMPQALLNYLEQAIPDALRIDSLRGFVPVLWYQLVRAAVPGTVWTSAAYSRKMNGVTTSGTLASYGRGPRPRVVFEGRDELFDDDHFFAPRDGRTRHNIIVALSHRHSFLDLALMAALFGEREFATWSNIQYFPKSAARDPLLVAVKPGEAQRMEATLARSMELLSERAVPLAVFVDGGSPYLPYSQQMRVKPGLRLLIDHVRGATPGSGRKSYLIPVSFNDTATFLRGLDDTLRVQSHPPIDLERIPDSPRPPVRTRPNRGDALLNHLECLYLTCTGQVRHGWRTPLVIDTVRRVEEETRRVHGLRPRLRRRFHASLMDLSRARDTRCRPTPEPD